MPDNTDVQIDGIPGKLIDVSLTGAQILVPAALKPRNLRRVTSSTAGRPILRTLPVRCPVARCTSHDWP